MFVDFNTNGAPKITQNVGIQLVGIINAMCFDQNKEQNMSNMLRVGPVYGWKLIHKGLAEKVTNEQIVIGEIRKLLDMNCHIEDIVTMLSNSKWRDRNNEIFTLDYVQKNIIDMLDII